jgi:mono/diheme cytochrome c family protein
MSPSLSRFPSASAIIAGIALYCSPASAEQSLVEHGAYLARAGDCQDCHTAHGAPAFSGGDPLQSPFGAFYPPNITPDKTYGIGSWSADDFYKAMHEGIGDHGKHLYPAFPYQWFTKVTREDVDAIKAYLDTIPPAHIPSKPDHLMFPFNIREGIAAWNAAYFHPGEFKPDPAKTAEWNRGAYLVEGLGHCGDCHTPKGATMAPIESQAFAGGQIDDWYAPNLTPDPTSGLGKWSDDDLVKYLQTGATPTHGVVAGPMAQVVHDGLAYLSQQDVRAIVTYLRDQKPIAEYKPDRPTELTGSRPSGEGIYIDHCSSCHQLNGQGLAGAVPALAGNGLVTAKGPENVIRVIIEGHVATGSFGPMPGAGDSMTDEQIAGVTDYIRNAWSNAAPVIDKTGLVGTIRQETRTTLMGVGSREENGDPCWPGEGEDVKAIADPNHVIDDALAKMTDVTMWNTVPGVLSSAKQSSPGISRADLVNGLTLAYCRVEARAGALQKPNGRRLLNQFSMLVYSELVSNGNE